MVEVNYLAILLCTILSMVLGTLWYGPLFGKPWMKMMGITKESMKGVSQTQMMKLYGIQTLGSIIMAYVLTHSIAFASNFLNISGIIAGLQGAFWNWLGFVAPVTLGSVLWEGKPWRFWLLNNGYYLILLSMMGIILSIWN